MAQMLKLIPASAENAHGRDYEMRPHSTSKTDFLASIKVGTRKMLYKDYIFCVMF